MQEPVLLPPLRQLIKQATRSVDDVVHKGQNLNRVLALQQDAGHAAIQDMCYAVLREYGTLSAIRDSLLSKPLSDRMIASLLVVALRQLRAHPEAAHAIVNEAVEAAAAMRPWARGLVNAVLRSYLRQDNAQMESGHPVALWNYPEWWIAEVESAYPDHWQDILMAGNRHPPMTLRINARRGDVASNLARLQKAGIVARQIGPAGLQLAQPVAVSRLPGFAAGLLSVQDAGAQLAAELLDLRDGQRVLDACAAPGGKTGHILERAEVNLTALDNDAGRLQRVRDNLLRLGLDAELKPGDAGSPDSWWDGVPYDRILADVPCSASGVVRRHPDIKWLRRAQDIDRFATQQALILSQLWRCLAVGGKLLYVTCSIFPKENQDRINAFLAQQDNARQIPLQGEWLTPGQLLPNDNHDGFFYALLEKK
ncbi:MAG TPA: 16S rRNA (cytosine(967)-C(5))-methyltransferase RsmB [Burkholderiales bacterium]|nr:16S rRNA (cytosine(967)-C(5))-methyltransferase RsmB [Burkholderiales bacterium]